MTVFGNCEEELPKKPVGRLSVNCRPTHYRAGNGDMWLKKDPTRKFFGIILKHDAIGKVKC